MNDDARKALLNATRPQFERLSGRGVGAILVHHAGEITAREVKQSVPELAHNPHQMGSLYGKLNGTPERSTWRSYGLLGADQAAAESFASIAEEAGNYIGGWGSTHLSPETVAEDAPELRWCHALFEIARRPGSPHKPRRSWIKSADIARLKMEASVAEDPDTAKLLAEAKRLASLGYVVKLRDVFRASVDAIDVLAEGEAPAVDVDAQGTASLKQDQPTNATANARMLDLLARRVESRDWTARQFAESLGLSASAVCGTKIWKELMSQREATKRARSGAHPERGEKK